MRKLEDIESNTACARVKIVADRKIVMVDIADDGPGLPDDALEQVFEPFFRLEPARNRNTGGAGIGLATVRTIARARRRCHAQ